MNNQEAIKQFIKNRPTAIAVYGYGSGVFKQSGYQKDDQVQLDLLFIVEDIKSWNLENAKINKKDYSLTGKLYFKNTKRETLIGKTGVTYLSNIEENGYTFKYGVIDFDTFKEALTTWSSFYLTGRFQKTIKEYHTTKEIQEIIETNRHSAVISSLLISKEKLSIKDLLVTLCTLSYAGDTRMAFAENPRKVLNIVEGSYQEFLKTYLEIIKKYVKVIEEEIHNKENLDLIKELPLNLKKSLTNQDMISTEDRYNAIMNYLSELNKEESKYQTIKGLKTNGFTRSINYGFAKVKKRFKK